MRQFLGRTAGAVRILIRDGDIPKPLRALAAFGLLPIPGPFDEAVLLLVAFVLFVFYRQRLGEAWARGRRDEAGIEERHAHSNADGSSAGTEA